MENRWTWSRLIWCTDAGLVHKGRLPKNIWISQRNVIDWLGISSVNALSLHYSLLPLQKKSWSFWTPRAQWPGWGKRSLSMSYWIFWKPWVRTILSPSTVSPKPQDPLLNVFLVKMMKEWSVRNWCRYILLYSISYVSKFI